MGFKNQIDADPEYRAKVDRVLRLHYEGHAQSEIGAIEGMDQGNVSEMIARYADQTIMPPRDADQEMRDQKIAIMHAAGFNDAEIARTFGTNPGAIVHALERLSGEIQAMTRKWRETTLEAGFASREMRIWSINQTLLYLEEETEEVLKIFVKTPDGLRTYETVPTGQKILRKFEKDQYGRPIWTVYLSKMLDELGKLKGDHSSTLNLGVLNPEARKLLDDINSAHRKALPAPVVDAEFSVKAAG